MLPLMTANCQEYWNRFESNFNESLSLQAGDRFIKGGKVPSWEDTEVCKGMKR
jgi:hypothetical protein